MNGKTETFRMLMNIILFIIRPFCVSDFCFMTTSRVAGKKQNGGTIMRYAKLFLAILVMTALPQVLAAMVLTGSHGNLPMVRQNVITTIDNQVAVTRLEQKFHNTAPTPIEAGYRFPLGEQASVQEFGLTTADGTRKIGAIEEQKEAEAIFQNAQQQGVMPALATSEGENTFVTKIGNVPANSFAVVDVTYSEILKYTNGTIFFSIPMNVKNIQASTLDMCSVTISIKDQKEIVKVTSPSHPVSATKISEHEWQVVFEKAGWLPDCDLVIAYEVKAERLGFNFLTTQPVTGEDGYFMMLLAPQEVVDAADIVARDIVFVVDVSGSMHGSKMEQTLEALHFFTDQLNSDDRFNILTFSDQVECMEKALTAANENNRRLTHERIHNIRAGGGTNIHGALEAALNQFDNGNSTKAIVFLTDGLPSVGITNIGNITDAMQKGNTRNVRTFAFGVGNDVSRTLLDKIALENRGEAIYVHENEPLREKLTKFYETISKPLLVDLSVEWGDIKVSDIYPRQLPNLYKGSQLMITGRYSGSGTHPINVKGSLNGQPVTFPLTGTFAQESAANRFTARVWAKAKADHLIQENRAYGELHERKAEVIRLSKTYHFVTPYTSFVAVSEQKVAAAPNFDKHRHNVSATVLPAPSTSQRNYQQQTAYVPRQVPQRPVQVITTTNAKPMKLWGAVGFFPAAIAVPNFKKAREQARGKSCAANMRVIQGAVEMYNMDHEEMMKNLDFSLLTGNAGYLKSTPMCPSNGFYSETDDLSISGTICCTIHNTADDLANDVNGKRVSYQYSNPWYVNLWNTCLPAIEMLVNIPLFLLGLYFSITIFIRLPLEFFGGILRAVFGKAS